MVCADGRWWFHFKTSILDTPELGNRTLFVSKDNMYMLFIIRHLTDRVNRRYNHCDKNTAKSYKKAFWVNSHWVKANTKAMWTQRGHNYFNTLNHIQVASVKISSNIAFTFVFACGEWLSLIYTESLRCRKEMSWIHFHGVKVHLHLVLREWLHR